MEFDEEELLSIQYKDLQGNDWLAYQGTNLSDWKLAETDVLENESWFGWAQGETYTRRPFTPVPAEESPVIGIEDFAKNNFRVYPNPVDKILISGLRGVDIFKFLMFREERFLRLILI